MQEDDHIFIERAVAGDVGAFMSLMKKYERLTFAIAYGVLRNRDDASEAAQHAIENAFHHLRALTDRAKFKSWFSQIVRNEALSMLRRKGDDPPADTVDLPTPDQPDPALTPDAHLVREELRKKVHRGLAKLSAEHAEVLSLYYLSDLSYADIAESLGISIKTVGTRMMRAKPEFEKAWRTLP